MAILDTFLSLLARGQDNALLRYSIANEYLRMDRPEAALPHLEQALARDPDYSAAWKLQGKTLHALGRSAEAIPVLTRGIAVAERKGDVQAAREMQVFLKRARAAAGTG
jgi:tetratricopeptide (TPR) repeat protein